MGLALVSVFFYRAWSAMCFFFSNFGTSFRHRGKVGGFSVLETFDLKFFRRKGLIGRREF